MNGPVPAARPAGGIRVHLERPTHPGRRIAFVRARGAWDDVVGSLSPVHVDSSGAVE